MEYKLLNPVTAHALGYKIDPEIKENANCYHFGAWTAYYKYLELQAQGREQEAYEAFRAMYEFKEAADYREWRAYTKK